MMKLLLSLIIFTLSSCTPAWAGYTIFTQNQITPEFILVRDAYGMVSVRNPGNPPNYPTGTTLVFRPATFDAFSADVNLRKELLDDPAGTAVDSAVLATFPALRTKILTDIQDIRACALDRITRNSGVSAVYDENYQAAVAVDAGEGDTTEMKNGMTATQYLAGFGARLGMNAAQFAAYIIAENKRVGPTAYQVEDEYLRLAYNIIPRETSIAKLLAYPDSYVRFCGP